jgi:hypothetical protein
MLLPAKKPSIVARGMEREKIPARRPGRVQEVMMTKSYFRDSISLMYSFKPISIATMVSSEMPSPARR